MAQRISYMADGGSLMVGNDDIQFFIPNGYGDGSFIATILESSEKDKRPKEAHWFGMFAGKGLRVYHYDCSASYGYTEIPDGQYMAYYLDGSIWLERYRTEPMEMDPNKDRKKKLAWTLGWDIYDMALDYTPYNKAIDGLIGEKDECIASIQSEILKNSAMIEEYKEIFSCAIAGEKFATEIAKGLITRLNDFQDEFFDGKKGGSV